MSASIEVTDDPVPVPVIEYCKSVTMNKLQFDAEVAAYKHFVARYRKQRDRQKRQVMANMLQYLVYSTEHGMKPSHALTDALESALEEEKEAKRQMYPLPLHQSIANVLTSSTHTKGRGQTTNWKMHTGTFYSEFNGAGRHWFSDWTAGEVLGSHVSFGSHRFHIGGATQRILKLLEDRYGLNFNQLEKDRQARKKARTME
ncbi:hypothetical protein HFO42_10575 [Rhizobium leguminosarum]|uniref:Uncharacterized protein n=1 Tax=Rhizobium leguminosarum TaxID=384 RepID=A0AAJ1A795_RHILE|nr:hypothetical protein [Rhizobium leguminosarum]MBY5537652.1 hypothetical protein [Rhizobium leguminosarum]MBY5595621.1 hypothetical protein [Rhizobium leguminosarum]MBY5628551.1 hypothetical protein [Rhizobium leguminosarum]